MIKNITLVALSVLLATSLHFNLKFTKLLDLNQHELLKANISVDNLNHQFNMCKILYRGN